jgi:hypothetical protein
MISTYSTNSGHIFAIAVLRFGPYALARMKSTMESSLGVALPYGFREIAIRRKPHVNGHPAKLRTIMHAA